MDLFVLLGLMALLAWASSFLGRSVSLVDPSEIFRGLFDARADLGWPTGVQEEYAAPALRLDPAAREAAGLLRAADEREAAGGVHAEGVPATSEIVEAAGQGCQVGPVRSVRCTRRPWR